MKGAAINGNAYHRRAGDLRVQRSKRSRINHQIRQKREKLMMLTDFDVNTSLVRPARTKGVGLNGGLFQEKLPPTPHSPFTQKAYTGLLSAHVLHYS